MAGETSGARDRADLGFTDALDDFDPAAWEPAPPRAAPKPAERQKTMARAEALGFRSREAVRDPIPNSVVQGAGEAASVRRRRTGRNQQFNLKARPETIAAYCAIADAQGWGLGETLEHAVALLEERYKDGNI